MDNNPQVAISIPFEEIPTPTHKVGDRVYPLNPENMTKCVGTVKRVKWQPLTKGSSKWVWRVLVRLDRPFYTSFAKKSLILIARSDSELRKEEPLCH